jgi:hypothetical protein
MSTINKIAPQMQSYSQLGYEWKPFIMNIQKSGFRSKVVNTDNLGLRFNNLKLKESIFDKDEILKNKSGVMVGASTVFGVGASHDNFTIPSLLTDKTDIHFYNIGGRAYSGFQEIILFNSLIGKFSNVDIAVIFSGVNDIFLNSYIDEYDEILGPMFFTNEFKEAMLLNNISWKKKLIKNFLNLFRKKNYIEKKFEIKKIANIMEITKRNISCWSTIKKGMNIKLVYFLQPFSNWCNRELSEEEKLIFKQLDEASKKTHNTLKSLNLEIYNKYKKFLAEKCRELDIDFFDCNEYFSNKKFDKKWLFVDRIHLTDLGNQFISEYIKSKI